MIKLKFNKIMFQKWLKNVSIINLDNILGRMIHVFITLIIVLMLEQNSQW